MRSIWAVGRNTIAQAVRMKVAIIFIILLVVLLPLMGIVVTGDGTLKGKLQTFVSYGLGLTNLLLCLLTLIVATYTISSDLKQRQIYTVLTKPIRRIELLTGKLLGVLVLDLVLLVLFGGVIYGFARYMPKLAKATDAEIVQAQNEFFTARASLTPKPVDVSEDVEKTYTELQSQGRLPSNMTTQQIKSQLARQKELATRAASPGYVLMWQFENVNLIDADQKLFIRFKYDVSVNPPDLNVYGRWMVGDDRPEYAGTAAAVPWDSGVRSDGIRIFREIEIDGKYVADDGYLAIMFQNLPQLNDTVVIFPPDGLEILYKTTTFESNFIRACGLIFLRLVFLAVLAILASISLSLPVAILLCAVVYFSGLASGFILESFDYLNQSASIIYTFTVRPIMKMLPHFDKFSPTEFIVPARVITWSILTQAIVSMVLIKSLILWLLSVLIFKRKEIAKVIIH